MTSSLPLLLPAKHRLKMFYTLRMPVSVQCKTVHYTLYTMYVFDITYQLSHIFYFIYHIYSPHTLHNTLCISTILYIPYIKTNGTAVSNNITNTPKPPWAYNPPR